MKKINELAQFYADKFESKKRDSGTRYVYIKDSTSTNPNPELYEAIREAHGDRFPDDFFYSTFSSLLDTIAGYNLEDINALEDVRHEIVASQVDIYTANLTKWLASGINNVYYLTEALKEYQPEDGFKLLAMAQYNAVDEVFDSVYKLLEEAAEAEENQEK